MNDITARALAQQAAVVGQKVVVVSSNSLMSEISFAIFDSLELPTATGIRRSNGRQRIDFVSGGSLRFITPRQEGAIRGHAADLVFVDADVDAAFADRSEIYEKLRQMTEGRRDARLIRA